MIKMMVHRHHGHRQDDQHEYFCCVGGAKAEKRFYSGFSIITQVMCGYDNELQLIRQERERFELGVDRK